MVRLSDNSWNSDWCMHPPPTVTNTGWLWTTGLISSLANSVKANKKTMECHCFQMGSWVHMNVVFSTLDLWIFWKLWVHDLRFVCWCFQKWQRPWQIIFHWIRRKYCCNNMLLFLEKNWRMTREKAGVLWHQCCCYLAVEFKVHRQSHVVTTSSWIPFEVRMFPQQNKCTCCQLLDITAKAFFSSPLWCYNLIWWIRHNKSDLWHP